MDVEDWLNSMGLDNPNAHYCHANVIFQILLRYNKFTCLFEDKSQQQYLSLLFLNFRNLLKKFHFINECASLKCFLESINMVPTENIDSLDFYGSLLDVFKTIFDESIINKLFFSSFNDNTIHKYFIYIYIANRIDIMDSIKEYYSAFNIDKAFFPEIRLFQSVYDLKDYEETYKFLSNNQSFIEYDCHYELSFVIHNINNVHFVIFIKFDDKWVRLDDKNVSISEEYFALASFSEENDFDIVHLIGYKSHMLKLLAPYFDVIDTTIKKFSNIIGLFTNRSFGYYNSRLFWIQRIIDTISVPNEAERSIIVVHNASIFNQLINTMDLLNIRYLSIKKGSTSEHKSNVVESIMTRFEKFVFISYTVLSELPNDLFLALDYIIVYINSPEDFIYDVIMRQVKYCAFLIEGDDILYKKIFESINSLDLNVDSDRSDYSQESINDYIISQDDSISNETFLNNKIGIFDHNIFVNTSERVEFLDHILASTDIEDYILLIFFPNLAILNEMINYIDKNGKSFIFIDSIITSDKRNIYRKINNNYYKFVFSSDFNLLIEEDLLFKEIDIILFYITSYNELSSNLFNLLIKTNLAIFVFELEENSCLSPFFQILFRWNIYIDVSISDINNDRFESIRKNTFININTDNITNSIIPQGEYREIYNIKKDRNFCIWMDNNFIPLNVLNILSRNKAIPNDFFPDFSYMYKNHPNVISKIRSDLYDTIYEINDGHYKHRCEICGSVFLKGETKSCCANGKNFSDCLIPPAPPDNILSTLSKDSLVLPTYIRKINEAFRMACRNGKIFGSVPNCGFLKIEGTPYALTKSIDQTAEHIIMTCIREKDNPNLNILKEPSKYMNTSEEKILEISNWLLEENPDFNIFVRNYEITKECNDNLTFLVGQINNDSTSIAIINDQRLNCDPSVMEAILKKNGERHRIDPRDLMYDRLVFPILFWNKNSGCGYRKENATNPTLTKQATILLLQPQREFWWNSLPMLRDEFICDVYGRKQDFTLQYLRNAQLKFMSEKSFRSNITGIESDTEQGKKFFLPSSFVGSKSYWNEIRDNTCALAVKYGAPTFFLTLTCNCYLPDYIGGFIHGESYNMNPVIVSRIWNIRFKKFMNFLLTKNVLGKVKSYVWRLEFQNRGLPHVHMLLWTDVDTNSPEEIDKYISTEMPRHHDFDSLTELERRRILDMRNCVEHFETHTHSFRCQGKGLKCCYGYPKPILLKTFIVEGKIHYMRSYLEDQNIVPYNPLLLWIWRSHMDIEAVNSAQAIHYILKYVSKNSSHNNLVVRPKLYYGVPVEKNDELAKYGAARVAGSVECCMNIFGFHNYKISPTIQLIKLHLPGEKMIFITPNESEERIKKKLDSFSLLERYFFRPIDHLFDSLTLVQYYEKYTIDCLNNTPETFEDVAPNNIKIVKKRKNEAVVNLPIIRPSQGDLFYLKLLLIRFPSRSFDELKKNIVGLECSTFREAAYSFALCQSDNEAFLTLEEAVLFYKTGHQLINLFALLIIDGADSISLYNSFKINLYMDFNADSDIEKEQMFLISLRKVLYGFQRKLADFNFSEPISDINDELYVSSELSRFQDLQKIMSKDYKESDLTDHQLNIMKGIFTDLSVPNVNRPVVFLQGRAGTGKTYTIKRLLQYAAKENFLIVPCATTGIAANQFDGGSTIHSMFGLGIKTFFDDGKVSTTIGTKSQRAELLRAVNAFIFDECSMLTNELMSTVDMVLRHIYSDSTSFNNQADRDYASYITNIQYAGKKILLVGDFLQLPPVSIAIPPIPVFDRLVISSPWWDNVNKYALTHQQRAPDQQWQTFLNKVANGNLPKDIKWTDIDGITVTKKILEAQMFFIAGTENSQIFPTDRQWISPKNEIANDMNRLFQEYFAKFHDKTDYIICVADHFIPESVPNSIGLQSECWKSMKNRMDLIEMSSLPKARLKFYKGDPIYLMRNYNKKLGLMKSTRGYIHSWGKSGRIINIVIDADEEIRMIHRIRFENNLFGVTFQRIQSPINLAYSSTVHKSQGLTLSKVVIDLRLDMWEHGQLYVALSRVKNPSDLCVLLREDSDYSIRAPFDPQVVNEVLNIESLCED